MHVTKDDPAIPVTSRKMLSSIEVRANPVAITGIALITRVLLMTHLAPNLVSKPWSGNERKIAKMNLPTN